ncbi:MAG: DUF4215 domain-containing protein, partial [Myxococcota bacterium]
MSVLASSVAQAAPCPYTNIGSLLGDPVLVGDTCFLGDDQTTTCNVAADGEDAAVTWTAPETGSYTFSTVGSTLDTVLAVASGSCGAEIDCNDDDGLVSGSTVSDVSLVAGELITIIIDGATGCDTFELSITGQWCGDGNVDSGEACDDGNQVAGDGCDASCAFENTCGDGVLDMDEECDDGSANSNTLPDACRLDCTRPTCGDGVVDPSEREICDDGNLLAGDGCDDLCLPERPGCPFTHLGSDVGDFLWTGDLCGFEDTEQSSCAPASAEEVTFIWTAPADGTYRFDALGSPVGTVLSLRSGSCDGAELRCNDDGVGDAAVLDSVSLLAGETVVVMLEAEGECGQVVLNISGAFCGNLAVDAGETCDDGNSLDGDGCDSGCMLEGTCGDGTTDAGEECDDGNFVSRDGCATDCTDELEFCGDGAAQAGVEACDDGGMNSDSAPDQCRTDCTNARCGDGVVDTGEQCDDGNPFDGDGCTGCILDANACPGADAGSAIGTAIFEGSSCVAQDFALGSCGGDGAELTVSWTAPSAGVFTFSSIGSTGDPVLYVRDGCGGMELACSDNAAGVDAQVSGIGLMAGESVVLFLDAAEGCSDYRLSVKEEICGDGFLDSTEQCDDGNIDSSDGCSDACVLESCGDGTLDASEGCDTGSSNSDVLPDACRTDCQAARCGDGVEDTGEECDDGN